MNLASIDRQLPLTIQDLGLYILHQPMMWPAYNVFLYQKLEHEVN